jgi:CNT family concentrative nucleoside transporter
MARAPSPRQLAPVPTKLVGRSEEEPLEAVIPFFGMVALMGIAWAMSNDRRNVPWRVVIGGTLLQIAFAIVILKTELGKRFFLWLSDGITALLGVSDRGASFLFGNLVQRNVPVGTPDAAGNLTPPPDGLERVAQVGAGFAFSVLPTIIFFSSLITILYYLGVLQWIVRLFARVMVKLMGTSGAESLSSAVNVFVGQTEAPLMIRPYVPTLTQSELMAVMVGGFANIAGGVLAAYVKMGVDAGHLIASSVMSAPASLVMAKLMFPEREESQTKGEVKVEVARPWANVIDAAAAGATDGVKLALNVGGMLIAFIALVALLNGGLGWVGGWFGNDDLDLETILGFLLQPLAWLMGVPWADADKIGALLGIKTVVNEFVGYLRLQEMVAAGQLSERATIIATYAMCGFANFSSIAIQIGGIGEMAPERKSDLARLGLRAMIAGSLATFQTATIAGFLL